VSAIASITFACEDPRRVAEFWAAATGYGHVEIPPERLAEIDAVVEPGSWAVLQHPGRIGPRLIFHKRPKSPAEHLPIHLDLSADDVEAEVERLLALGATIAERKIDPFGAPLVVMRDPEGNGFCVE
jgi:predicted enzyme related to lactoylglutathione lyase